jgi:hypothetical protein
MTHTLAVIAALFLSAADEAPAAPPGEDGLSGYTARRHLELSMGFLGGVRDETRAGYAFSSGTADVFPHAQALATPFALAPYDRTIVSGLAWETRYVSQHLRFTVGLSKPFAAFRMMDAIFPTDVGGTTREVGTRSLTLWDVRFGLGGEYSFRHVAPFVDVIGDAQSISAAMTIDGETAQYRAWTFGFVVRAGLRIHMGDNLFVAPTGELGLGGPVKWAVGLQAGVLIPLDV